MAKQSKRVSKAVGVLTLHGVAEMGVQNKCALARWLRRQATFVTMHGYEMSKRYTSRYMDEDLPKSRREK